MRGAKFPQGVWADSPIRLFEQDAVQILLESGEWIAGTLLVVAGGIELVFDEARSLDGRSLESSRILSRADVHKVRAIVRPEALWSDATRKRRERQVWDAARPPFPQRVRSWFRELVGHDPIAREPLLRRYLGRRVVLETERAEKPLFSTGLLLAYDEEFLALADAKVPAETSLPLCPGQIRGAGLEIHWSGDAVHIENRDEDPLEILGIRTAEGFLRWPVRLKPGRSDQRFFPKAPAGTAEIVFETMVAGDIIASRAITRVRGGSEGSVSILALPDPELKVGELPETSASVDEPQPEGEPAWRTSN